MFDPKTFLFVVLKVILQIGVCDGKGFDVVFKKNAQTTPLVFDYPAGELVRTGVPFLTLGYSKFAS